MEGEERAELWHHPQPFLQHIGVITKRRQQTKEGQRMKKRGTKMYRGVCNKRAEETTKGSERDETTQF